jgi:hypothetical protein
MRRQTEAGGRMNHNITKEGNKPVLSREQIEAFRRIAKVEFQGTRVDQICDLALRAIDRQEDRRNAERPITELSDERADKEGCAKFVEAMLSKLRLKRAEGKYGWNDPSVCSIEELSLWLGEHILKGDPVDIANYCMMIWNRRAAMAQQEKKDG